MVNKHLLPLAKNFLSSRAVNWISRQRLPKITLIGLMFPVGSDLTPLAGY